MRSGRRGGGPFAMACGTAVMSLSCTRCTGMGGQGGARGVSPAIRRMDYVAADWSHWRTV